MTMIQICYIIFPLNHTVSDQEEVESKGEEQLSPETAALLPEWDYHQGPHQEEVVPAPPALTQSPRDLRISEMRYQGSFGHYGRRTRGIASPNNLR
jgi:hypothetical protein